MDRIDCESFNILILLFMTVPYKDPVTNKNWFPHNLPVNFQSTYRWNHEINEETQMNQ